MANTDCSFEQHLESVWDEAWEEAGKHTDEIFGGKEALPEDELELIFSKAFGNLSQAEKLKALRDHRAKTIEGWN